MDGYYDEISIEEVIARTRMQLKLNDGSWDSFLEVTIREALRELRAPSVIVKQQCTLEVVDGKAKLPSGFWRLLELRLNNQPVTDPITGVTTNQCYSYLYADTKFLSNCGCTTDGVLDFMKTFQIAKGYIWFPDGTIAEEVQMAYMGYNVDEKGRTMIYAMHERALWNYACYMFFMTNPELANGMIIDQYNRTWIAQKSMVNGIGNEMLFQENKRLIQTFWNSLATSRLMNF